MVAGLTSAFHNIALFGKSGNDWDAERGMYADFLEEAAHILNKPVLNDVAQHFRLSGQAWRELAYALLPDDVALFKEMRDLMVDSHRLFREQGNAALTAVQQKNSRLEALKKESETDFSLTQAEVDAMLANVREHVLNIHAIEQEAVIKLQKAML